MTWRIKGHKKWKHPREVIHDLQRGLIVLRNPPGNPHWSWTQESFKLWPRLLIKEIELIAAIKREHTWKTKE